MNVILATSFAVSSFFTSKIKFLQALVYNSVLPYFSIQTMYLFPWTCLPIMTDLPVMSMLLPCLFTRHHWVSSWLVCTFAKALLNRSTQPCLLFCIQKYLFSRFQKFKVKKVRSWAAVGFLKTIEGAIDVIFRELVHCAVSVPFCLGGVNKHLRAELVPGPACRRPSKDTACVMLFSSAHCRQGCVFVNCRWERCKLASVTS